MTGPAEMSPADVLASWDETPSLRALRLALPRALAARHVAPGQIVKARTPEGEAFFALATAPASDGRAELLVKRGGRVADAVLATAHPGAALQVTAPFGDGFPVDEARGRDVLLFAAGSAIAPIRALIQALVARRDDFDRVTLFYGQRSGAEFAYRGEHLSWERRGVRVILCPSGAEDGWSGVQGRVQEVARTVAFGGAPPHDAVAFVSGMTAMVDDVRATLAAAGVPPERVHLNL
jgi:sulfhydrogenase subunit gamma (sulfur reductase)